MKKILLEDVRDFSKYFELSDALAGCKFLITGATGLIGSVLVRCLLALENDIEVVCPVRNLAKAQAMFCDVSGELCLVESELQDFLEGLNEEDAYDYIVHCASPTSGKYIIEHPAETYIFAMETTHAILEYARKRKIRGVVYLSSLEYYGQNFDDKIITEDFQGYIDNMSPRSAYPLGKRAAEFLCAAYAAQFGVNVKVARLTQTFGAGVARDDKRVFAQFARSVADGEDIVLHTTGESAKPYCYSTDSVSAILYILLRGERGGAYNVANEETYISIKDLALFLRDHFNPGIKVRVEAHPEMGYAPVTKLRLSAKKLSALGWKPRYGLKEQFERLIASFK